MGNVNTSPNMKLPVPTLQDSGPDYANNVNTSLDIIDAHDHDGINGGVKLDLSIQDCLGDLSVASNNVSNVRSVELNDNPSQLVGSQDVNCLYVNGGVLVGGIPTLGFNNSNGVFIPLTAGNTLAITALSLTNFASRNIVSNAVILPSDTYNLVNVNSTSGPVTVTLPIASTITPTAANRLYIIRDVGELAGANNITIQVAGGSGNIFTDSGLTSFVLSSDGAYVGIYTDGVSNWYTFTQNTYNGEFVQYNASSSINLLNSFMNLNASSLNAGAGSAINLVSSTEVVDSASQILADGNIIVRTGGHLATNAGATLSINGRMDGSTTSGGLVIAGTGSITASVGGAIKSSTVAGISDGGTLGGIVATVQGGIGSTAFGGIQSVINGGLQNGAGPGDWVSFADVGGRKETRNYPLNCNAQKTFASSQNLQGTYTEAFWTNGWSSDSSGPNDSTVWYSPLTIPGILQSENNHYNIFQVPQLHSGAVLNSVDAVFFVSNDSGFGSMTGVPWALVFNIMVYRVDMATTGLGAPSPFANKDYLSSLQNIQCPYGPVPYPGNPVITPSNSAAWYNGGNFQYMTYYCDGSNNVVNNTRYAYYIGIRDVLGQVTSGLFTAGGTGMVQLFSAMRLNYTTITDMRFI